MDRLNGGGSRGDHGEALGERGNAFLLRRVSKARVKVRPAMADGCGLALRAGKAKEGQMEQATRSGKRWPSSGARMRDMVASVEHERHAASGSYVGWPRRL